ncbi:DUF7331 family protein [Halobacterium zhouii]|nr:hypothetical protein [Halobacterium zhouii]
MEQSTPTVPLRLETSDDGVVISDPENDDAWLRSDVTASVR